MLMSSAHASRCLHNKRGMERWKNYCCHAGVIGGVIAFTLAHVAKLVLDWVAAKTGCCTSGASGAPLEAAEEVHVIAPKGASTAPTTVAPPVSRTLLGNSTETVCILRLCTYIRKNFMTPSKKVSSRRLP